MPKRRKRTRLRPKPFLWLGLVICVTSGMFYSRITSVTRLRVEGRPDPAVESVSHLITDVPCALVNPRQVESTLLALPETRSAYLSRNPFGSAVLKVRYRRPILAIERHPNVVVAVDGVLYKLKEKDASLSILDVPDSWLNPEFSIVSGTPWFAFSDFALNIQELVPNKPFRIAIADDGSVWLNILSGRVKFGDLSYLDSKLRVLRSRLEQDPEVLSKIEALILTSPANPFIVPRKAERKR